MKKGFVFLLASSALAVGYVAGAQARHDERPPTLSAVRPGMQKDVVLSGLTERYDLTKIPDEESWFVVGKTEREGGTLTFSDGKVKSVQEFLTETDSADTISFAKDLYTYLKSEIPQISSDAVSAKRRGMVVVELEEKHYRKGGSTVDFDSIQFRFKDAVYELMASDSSFGPNAGPDLKITRIRGQ